MKKTILVVIAMLAVGCVADSESLEKPWKTTEEDEEIEHHEDYDLPPDDDCYNNCYYDDGPLHPVSEPVPEGEVVACDTPRACEVECVIDVASGESNCDLTLDGARAIVDMTGHESLTIRATLSDPTGFSFHLGDSPSNNGHGGDGAEFSRDAELHLVDTTLYVYGSDHSLDEPNRVRKFSEFLPADGGVVELTLTDGGLSLHMDEDPFEPMCFVQRSHDLLRLEADDIEGSRDQLWYLGLNQVYSGGRTGSGLERVELCFN